jgi:Lar family restriction alleviation protein
MNRFKPCPFCGSHQVEIFRNSRQEWFVACDDCGGGGPHSDFELGAIGKWNKRKCKPLGKAAKLPVQVK